MNVRSWIFNPMFSFLKLLLSQTNIPLVTIHLHPCPSVTPPVTFRRKCDAVWVQIPIRLILYQSSCVCGEQKACCEEAKPPHHWRHWSLIMTVYQLPGQQRPSVWVTRPVYVLAEGKMAPCLCLQTRVPTSSPWLESVPQACPLSAVHSSIVCEPAKEMDRAKPTPRERGDYLLPGTAF